MDFWDSREQQFKNCINTTGIAGVCRVGYTRCTSFAATLEVVVRTIAGEIQRLLEQWAQSVVQFLPFVFAAGPHPHCEVEGWEKESLHSVHTLPWGQHQCEQLLAHHNGGLHRAILVNYAVSHGSSQERVAIEVVEVRNGLTVYKERCWLCTH